MEIRLYCQSAAVFFTAATNRDGVIAGPEGIRRGSFCPEANILMCVPPISITRIVLADFFIDSGGILTLLWRGIPRAGREAKRDSARLNIYGSRLRRSMFPLVFPQIADGSGFTTQFVFISGSGTAAVSVSFAGDDGQPLWIGLNQ